MDSSLDFGIQKAYKPTAICTLDVTNLKVNEIKQSTLVHTRKPHCNTRIVPCTKEEYSTQKRIQTLVPFLTTGSTCDICKAKANSRATVTQTERVRAWILGRFARWQFAQTKSIRPMLSFFKPEKKEKAWKHSDSLHMWNPRLTKITSRRS